MNLCESIFGFVRNYAGKQTIETHVMLTSDKTDNLNNGTEAIMRGFMAESVRWTKAVQMLKASGVRHNIDELETSSRDETWKTEGREGQVTVLRA